MTSYTTLIDAKSVDGSIKNWVNDDRIGPATIVTEAEAWIYQRLRVRDMLAYISGTMTATEAGAAITLASPNLFKAPYDFRITGSAQNIPPSEIKKKSLALVRSMFSWTGTPPARVAGRPKWYALDATRIIFDCAPDRAYPYEFAHFSRPSSPLSTALTNFLTEKYPSLLRHVCMFKSFEHLRRPDERRYHLELAGAELQSVNIDSDMANETEEFDIEVV